MKKVFYRCVQSTFALFVGLVQNKVTKLVRGEGSLLKSIDLLKEKNVSKLLIVTTSGFVRRGSLESLETELKANNIEYFIYTGVNPDPSVNDVEGGVKFYKENNCEAILAIGGGSVLDCAKVIGARVSNPKTSVRKMRGMLKVKKKLPTYIPVPTTCGTGSEVTAAAVITDEINNRHYKYAVTDLKLIPDVAILDPNMLKSITPFMLVTTTMDALTHSLEAYTNLFVSKEIKKDSLESIKLIFDNLENAYTNKDSESLDNLLYASTLAGIAITHNFVGYVHAIAHAVGALYHLPHGYLNSIILPVLLKVYEKDIEDKMKLLCEYSNIEKTTSYTGAIIERINKLKELENLPSTIKELKEEDFDEVVNRANKEANPTYPVPTILNKKQLKEVLYTLKG